MISVLAIKAFWSTWWRAALGAAVVAGPCLTLGYCQGKSAGEAKMEAAAAIATVEVMKTDGSAKEVAAVERVNDILAVEETKKELTDAVAKLPDSVPSPRRVALACARLRTQGIDTASLPACR
jgi:hypothetical protein